MRINRRRSAGGRVRAAGRIARFEVMEPRMLLSTAPSISPQGLASDTSQAQLAAGAMAIGSFTWTGLSQVRSQYNFTGQGQTVVVIDSGVDYNQAALGGGFGSGYHVVGGYDFADGNANPFDGGPAGGHGTEVAGIIASQDAADPGVAPGVDLVALKVFDNNGNCTSLTVDQALQWVQANRNSFRYPITTVNLSLGNNTNSETLPPGGGFENDLAKLEADGMFISVAAGNGFASYGQPGLSYPAISPDVVPVGAADAGGAISSFSQRDSRVLLAPGSNVLTITPDYDGDKNGVENDFARCSGTSMAAPFVAGASVLMRQAYETVGVKNVNEQMIYNEMLSTADIVYDAATGQDYHRLNLERAIDSIMASWTPPPAAAATPTSSTTSSTTTPAAPVAVKTSPVAPTPAPVVATAVPVAATSAPVAAPPVAVVAPARPVVVPVAVPVVSQPVAPVVTTGTSLLRLFMARGARQPAVLSLPSSEVDSKLSLELRYMLAQP